MRDCKGDRRASTGRGRAADAAGGRGRRAFAACGRVGNDRLEPGAVREAAAEGVAADGVRLGRSGDRVVVSDARRCDGALEDVEVDLDAGTWLTVGGQPSGEERASGRWLVAGVQRER